MTTGRYRVLIANAATRDLERLPANVRGRVAAAIRALADDPRPPGCKKLVGQGGDYRIRVGDYRVLYEVRDSELVVLVVRMRHRRDVYRR